ncbi:hypothetical protein MML48_6g00003759 [Holotrichia oblita]|uniref:Uncharacterized protein n=1 Tax=Holotrichia oblita TaxID=644536 RepID=A0ACB9SZ49_HOLOL|nr:hypothetical protein MML48_6g00003759 [Holotrichia oblita]
MSKLIFWLFLLRFSTFTYECVITQDYYWRDYSFGAIPYDAIEINNDGKYIGQVYLKGGLLPATIYPYLGYAVTELFGKQIVTQQIKVTLYLILCILLKILCSPDHSKLYWQSVDFSKPATDGQMKHAILGGFYKDNTYDFNYFIGKLLHQGEWKAGKVIPHEHPSKGLFIWSNTDSKGAKFSQFHMLKYNLNVTTHDYYWREYAFRTVPYDAVEIANDEKYIGQVYVNGGLVPATIYPYLGYAVTELFGKQIVKDHIKVSSLTQNYYWRDYSFGQIPYDAFEVADDGKYIGQVYVDGGLVPATIYPYLGVAIGELHGKQVIKEHVKIFCSPDHSKLYWDLVDFDKPASAGQMRNAILGGFHNDIQNVFIGKFLHEGEWKVGRVLPMENNYKGLLVWNDADGQSVHVKQFYMLKYNASIEFPENMQNIYLYIEPFTQDYYWRDYAPGDIPYDAVEVANDGKYIGQVYVDGGVVPASIYSHLGHALTELHGRQIIKENIKILCCPDHSKLYWEYVDFNRSAVGVMRNAILGGFHKDAGKVFIGKVNHEGEWKATKILSIEHTYNGLTAWKNSDGSALLLKQFYMLKYHSKTPLSSRYFAHHHSKLYWDFVDFDKSASAGQMRNAILGGFHNDIQNVFIGKFLHEGEWKVGRVLPMENNYKGLLVWNDVDGQSVHVKQC